MNLPKTVPLLPGFQFTDPFVSLTPFHLNLKKQNFHKTQQFSVVNGVNRGNILPSYS